jgi:hypothetical protein
VSIPAFIACVIVLAFVGWFVYSGVRGPGPVDPGLVASDEYAARLQEKNDAWAVGGFLALLASMGISLAICSALLRVSVVARATYTDEDGGMLRISGTDSRLCDELVGQIGMQDVTSSTD